MEYIKFRAKRKDNGQWIYWNLLDGFSDPKSIIDVKTIGQCTGIEDKDGKEIYSGDIVEFETPGGRQRPYVAYQENLAAFILDYWINGQKKSLGDFLYEIVRGVENMVEVIGNVHDNPELLRWRS